MAHNGPVNPTADLPDPSRPTADVSVRVGWPADAVGIAEVQVAAWREELVDVLPAQVLVDLDADRFATTWHASMARPEDARNRVLVALERNTLRGFAVTMPSPDPDSDPVADGELAELVVHPAHRGAGHGSRLLQACVDTLRADRFTRATCWLTSSDDVRRRFLTDAGWAPDGAHRELELHGDGSVRVKQVRLHTDLQEG
jgi:GNAT superfamily N-acetyltransferase